MREMAADAAVAFLSAGTRTGHLATVRDDGRPHVAPIWFVVEGDHLVFTTWHDSVKGRNLRQAGRAAISVDDARPPYSFVAVEGEVTIDDDVAEARRVATVIGGRYMGADRAEEFGSRNGVAGELVVRLAMDRVIARADVSD